jgi:hypothetical protein
MYKKVFSNCLSTFAHGRRFGLVINVDRFLDR